MMIRRMAGAIIAYGAWWSGRAAWSGAEPTVLLWLVAVVSASVVLELASYEYVEYVGRRNVRLLKALSAQLHYDTEVKTKSESSH